MNFFFVIRHIIFTINLCTLCLISYQKARFFTYIPQGATHTYRTMNAYVCEIMAERSRIPPQKTRTFFQKIKSFSEKITAF